MGAAQRQKAFRKKAKEQGMVDIRFEIPITVRDKIKTVALARNKTMKTVMQEALESLARTTQV